MCTHNWESTMSLLFMVDTDEACRKAGISGPGLQTSLPWIHQYKLSFTLHQAKWAESIWRDLVCKHLSDSNFFLFVLKFNYGCIWTEINGDNFSPTDGGLFECALILLVSPCGEREGHQESQAGGLRFSSRTEAFFISPSHHIRKSLGSWAHVSVGQTSNNRNMTQCITFTPTVCDSRQATSHRQTAPYWVKVFRWPWPLLCVAWVLWVLLLL